MAQVRSRSNALLWWGLALLALGLLGLLLTAAWGARAPGWGWPHPRMPWRPGAAPAPRFETNGERLYYTGTNDRGEIIPFSGGPPWFRMHGGGCVDCHGVTGRGGTPVMMGTAIPTDIRYSALTRPGHDDHPPYTDETLRRAIREGRDPAGRALDPTMPRFRISAEDLDDLLQHLRALDGRR